MTQEEKAKAYDDAIERAKIWQEHLYEVDDKDYADELNYIFPELAESEDEIIRKHLIDCVTRTIPEADAFKEISKEQILDWLEKQGQKPVEWKQENREELTEFENAMMHIGGSFFGENAGLDPNDTDTIKEQAELLLELAPKTEWSKEDKNFMYDTLSNLTELKDRYGEGYGNVGKCIDWLESIKQRHTWKPSKEQIICFASGYKWLFL